MLPKVTNEALGRTQETLTNAKYDLNALLDTIREENPKVAEYIRFQADKSRKPLEVMGAGIVVYLLLKY